MSINRRVFVQNGAIVMGGIGILGGSRFASVANSHAAGPEPAALRVGLLTDCHYADRDTAGSRHYRESLDKVGEAVRKLNGLKADLMVEMGDFIDAAPDPQTEIKYLKAIDRVYAEFHGPRHYVLGNHCVYTLTKQEFIDHCDMPKSYYSFDKGPFHFIILDACFREDGVAYGRQNYEWTDTNISAEQVEWLKADLAECDRQAIVFVHQRLDLDREDSVGKHYAIKNAPQVRKVLERSGKVLLVMQGHSHENEYRLRDGIHYCVLRAVVEGSGAENNGYGMMHLFRDGSVRIEGFREQKSYAWADGA